MLQSIQSSFLYGKNRELLEHCQFLKDYMTFVDYVRDNHKENDYDNLGHCIELALDHCIEENVLREFLIRRRTEVVMEDIADDLEKLNGNNVDEWIRLMNAGTEEELKVMIASKNMGVRMAAMKMKN